MPPKAAAAPPPAAVSRLEHEVFAASATIRHVCNEPVELTRILWGVEEHRPLDDVVADMHKALLDELPRLNPMSPYYEACGHAEMQFEHYRQLSTALTLDHVKALSMYTLENPRYYDMQNKAAYCTYAGQAHKDFTLFAHVIAYINTGLQELASLHRCGRLQPRQPKKLVRFAWIPDAVWEQHYREGNSVVFLAPMSTSPMWSDDAERAMSPVWEFLDRPKTGHTPCLLEFDSMLARQAGQLGHPQHPISMYGAAEKEWTLPSYVRGRVASITDVGAPGGRQATIKHVLIEGIPMLSAIRPSERTDTVEVLLAAVTVAVFAEHGPGEAPVMRLLEGFCQSLASAVWVRAPGEVITCPDYVRRAADVLSAMQAVTFVVPSLQAVATASSIGMTLILIMRARRMATPKKEQKERVFVAGADGRTFVLEDLSWLPFANWKARIPDERAMARVERARHSAQSSAQARVSRIGAAEEAHAQEVDLERLAMELSYDLRDIFACVKGSMGEMAASADSTVPWLKLVAHMNFLADVIDMRQEIAEMLVDTAPLQPIQGRKFLEPITRLGDELWEQAPPYAAPELHAWRAAAWLDCLRVRLATTRMLVLAGSPDAGKTTLLEQVFHIKSRGGAGLGEAHRTAAVSLYQHPKYNTEFVPAYVVDTPGFGDSVEVRNNMVRCLLHCIGALGPGVGFVWVMRAGRDVKTVADDFYSLLLPLCRLVVVTCVDITVQARVQDLYNILDKEDFDFDNQEALARERLCMMQSVKEEALQQVRRLSGDQPPPAVRFAVLAPDSWAFAGSSGGRRRRAPTSPPPWETARADVARVFELVSASALQELLDQEMGIPQ